MKNKEERYEAVAETLHTMSVKRKGARSSRMNH